jgi:hypothetical protein
VEASTHISKERLEGKAMCDKDGVLSVRPERMMPEAIMVKPKP